MNLAPRIIQVALPSPFRRLFDYRLPKEYKDPAIGSRVSVPFGHQKPLVGIVISQEPSSTPPEKLRDIHSILDPSPVMDSALLQLCQWCADYYHYPLGEVCQVALPATLRKPAPLKERSQIIWKLEAEGQSYSPDLLKNAPKQQEALSHFQEKIIIPAEMIKERNISQATLKALVKKQLIAQSERKMSPAISPKPSSKKDLLKEEPLTLNPEQKAALDTIQYDEFNTMLLDGVTGSGKTEVYLQAIEQVLHDGKQVIVLVPEIGLTPQTVSRFEKRFNRSIATLHSGLSDKRRFEMWQQAKSGELQIIIGTRSSIFTPLPQLGLIIIDEEHDLSYKQQEGVRYSARDVAMVRAHKAKIPLILGSATPALESLHNALSGRYGHQLLRQRAKQQTPPTIECIDTGESDIAEATLDAIQQTLAKGQQVLVFINRRGYAPVLNCSDCGWMALCQRCDSRMTLHKGKQFQGQSLHCHHCDNRGAVPTQCPHCHSRNLKPLGTGTQRSEETLEKVITQAPVLRIDRDSISRKGQLEATLQKINTGEPCVLIGTQMLAKGHHFPKLGLGVILGLDQAFFSSDFRGAERMGQLLTQVAGRIGRESHQGKVFIQTRFSEHPLLRLLLDEGYGAFAKHLLTERELTGMPPFEHIALIRCHAQQAQLAEAFLKQARKIAQDIIPPHDKFQYLGPFPAAMEKRNNRYHYLLQIKAANRKERQHLLQHLCERLEKVKQARGLHWLIDVDAQEF
ncbi:MAG: primosomal protein N' [Cellvibrionaceae bacterium]